MTSGLGIMDILLTLYLSEGMMIFTVILLVISVIGFIKGKRHSLFRRVCLLIGIYCIIYLGAILALVFMFDSSHEPAQPVIAYLHRVIC